jgi:AcrR family transcriptional regulator
MRTEQATTSAARSSEASVPSTDAIATRRPYKLGARAASTERTRNALLDAAEEELYNDHWRQTSLESLARKAGVTKQTLLRHFGSKDGLLLQALGRGAVDIFNQRFNAPSSDIPGAVEDLLDHYEAWGERSLRIGAWQRGPAALAKLSQLARQVHYNWVEHAFGPWLKPLDGQTRQRRSAALIALCDVNTWWLWAHDLALPRAEIAVTLTDAIERLLVDEGQPEQ